MKYYKGHIRTLAGVSTTPIPVSLFRANAVATQSVIVSGTIASTSTLPLALQFKQDTKLPVKM